MSKGSYVSVSVAVVTGVLTATVIAGVITMAIVYQTELSKLDPTPRPTIPPTTTAPPPVLRLPTALVPERYKIYIQPHFYTHIKEANVTNQTMLFTGNSTVNFRCVQPTKTIYLHSEHLTIGDDGKVVNTNTNEAIRISSVDNQSSPTNFLEIMLDDVLEEGGNYSLFLSFKGEMFGLTGLYVSTYTEGRTGDGDNGERFLATSQMQPTYARSVFPCFDEPAMKAVFEVTIIHRTKTTALGNWVASDRRNTLDDEWQYTSFHPTRKMSTYLLAFTVTNFTPTTSLSLGRVTIKTYARPEATQAGHAVYAASITGEILAFYEAHFGIKYPLTKLDQIAVPDFYNGAMENWGCIHYQEALLLYEEGVSSQLHKETIIKIISHEIAHQWFGNLVTMRWWNETWLNEGFATFMAYLAVDHIESDFNMKDTFVIQDLHTAFVEDALTSSHPLSSPENDVQTPIQILEMFDDITYAKGASVLRMLEDFVTPKVFHNGIKMYLNAFQYGNTEQNDLWTYIQKAVDNDQIIVQVAEVMETWTNQIGFPLITINTTNGKISQRHFLYNDTSESRENFFFDSFSHLYSLLWDIPIRFMSNTTGPVLHWLKASTGQKEDFEAKDKGWILANVNCSGYYRVNYDPENWNRLMTQLETNPERIPVINRWQLIDDAFNLARAKIVNVTLALNSTRFLKNETAYLPWESAVMNFAYIVLMFDRSEVYGPMQTYLRRQISGLYDFFRNCTDNSTVPDDHSQQHNQILAIGVACANDLPECQAMAKEMFALWMTNDTNIIHPNLRSVIYCQAVAAGGQEEWEFAWDKFQKTTDTSAKQQLREALSCTKKIWLLSRYLEYTLMPEKIRPADVPSIIDEVATNVVGQDLVWNFVRAHWTGIIMDEGAAVIDSVTRRFSTDFELQELKRFQKDYELGSASRAVEQAIEQTKINIQWVKENKQVILKWFQIQIAS